jgi:hypothetical protein
MTGHAPDGWRTDAALDVLLKEAERARRALDVAVVSISVWERDRRLLRTLVNADVLGAGAEAKPPDEVYPVDSFPALARLLEQRIPYYFGHGDPVDVSSASLAASLGMDTQASAPITLRGEVWGSLWVATAAGDRGLSAGAIPRIVRAANGVARVLADLE